MALGLTYISQFLNDMTIRALATSFIPAAWFTLTYRLKKPKDGVVLSFIKLVLEIILTIAIAGGIQYVIKMLIQGMTNINPRILRVVQTQSIPFFKIDVGNSRIRHGKTVDFESQMTGQPDEHIFKFLQAKFGIAETDDFDAKLYLCNGAFQFLPFDTFGRLLGTK